MKKCLLLVFVVFSLNAVAQNDSNSRSSIFSAYLKVGSFYGQSTPTQKIQGFAYNPYISFGKKLKFNLGYLIVSLDTNGQGIDTLETQIDNFEIGLSFEERIPNTNLFIGGGLNLFGEDGDNPFLGNRVMANAGYILDGNLASFSVQASRTFNRNGGISGSLLMFGIDIRF
jgi:hypothetical protein